MICETTKHTKKITSRASSPFVVDAPRTSASDGVTPSRPPRARDRRRLTPVSTAPDVHGRRRRRRRSRARDARWASRRVVYGRRSPDARYEVSISSARGRDVGLGRDSPCVLEDDDDVMPRHDAAPRTTHRQLTIRSSSPDGRRRSSVAMLTDRPSGLTDRPTSMTDRPP